jgi:hypothetical protein
MRFTDRFICGALVLILAAACSNEPGTSGREGANRNSAADQKSDTGEPVDAAGRTPDKAGKCIAGACADSSPPTMP